ncbi:MAG: alcohol dehydrogenase [Candidatus Solibacter sp.]|nr:alcohol dehydrogenase [Candidatus Solibacter sp.]
MRAIYLEQGEPASLAEVTAPAASGGDVLVRIEYSSLNYKDALAITGKAPIVRKYPMVAGIDFAGAVDESGDARFQPGDRVLANGHGLGEDHWGGLASHVRVPADWLQAVPDPFSTRDAMCAGTAGYTAALAVQALIKHGLKRDAGPILVTGASGGVGGFAVMLLSALGFDVAASTGRAEETSYLKSLGASAIVPRDELSAPHKPLAKARWAGVIDSAGGIILANAVAAVTPRGAVASCGNAGGMDFPVTVAPFILRGVTLHGIDSNHAPMSERETAWGLLAAHIPPLRMHVMAREIGLAGVISAAGELLAGHIRGRIVVDVRL